MIGLLRTKLVIHLKVSSDHVYEFTTNFFIMYIEHKLFLVYKVTLSTVLINLK